MVERYADGVRDGDDGVVLLARAIPASQEQAACRPAPRAGEKRAGREPAKDQSKRRNEGKPARSGLPSASTRQRAGQKAAARGVHDADAQPQGDGAGVSSEAANLLQTIQPRHHLAVDCGGLRLRLHPHELRVLGKVPGRL